MALTYFDVNAYIGRPVKAIPGAACGLDALLADMDRAGVAGALVWHVAQFDCSPQDGNRLLVDEIQHCDRLVGCWTVLPPVTGEVVVRQGASAFLCRDASGTLVSFFDEMKRNRIVALRAFPDHNRCLLDRVSFGGFLDEVSERRIPLLLSLERGITWPAIYQAMKDFPGLTCILCDIGVWGQDRYTWPLLETYPNVRVETSMLSVEAGGLEASVRKFGADRFVFGTGFPARYPDAAMLQLAHADIPDADKLKIASGNLEALLSEVRL